jgi:hypothetical protein
MILLGILLFLLFPIILTILNNHSASEVMWMTVGTVVWLFMVFCTALSNPAAAGLECGIGWGFLVYLSFIPNKNNQLQKLQQAIPASCEYTLCNPIWDPDTDEIVFEQRLIRKQIKKLKGG